MTVAEARCVLGLRGSATDQQIQTKYRNLVKVFHPDRFQEQLDLSSFANENLALINEAYETLLRRPRSRSRRGSRPSSERESPSTAAPASPESSFEAGSESDGLPRPVNINKHWIYVDAAGRKMIDREFVIARPFHEGRAAVADSIIGWHFIKLNGDPIRGAFEDTADFSEGLAGVCVDQRWGFIDLDANFIVEPRFTAVHAFSEGIAAVRESYQGRWWSVSKERWGFIDRTGTLTIKPRFDTVFGGGFHGGEALVKLGKAWAVVDRHGNLRSTANPPVES